jgi:hypothetical protein
MVPSGDGSNHSSSISIRPSAVVFSVSSKRRITPVYHRVGENRRVAAIIHGTEW